MSSRPLFSDPLLLKPRLLPKVWGGDSLAGLFGKALPDGEPLGESWEVYDRSEGSSPVREGPLKGRSLHSLLEEDPAGLLGRPPGNGKEERFPLMVKFLDARGLLSIQVHPPWEYAARVEGDQGKAEAWLVLAAEPGAKVYLGLRPGTGREDLEEACRLGRVGDLLQSFTPRPGDLFWIPPGTVHGLGGGVVAYEVQTNSDVTYRLFDWNRAGLDGRPRELHLDKAFEVIDFSAPPPSGPLRPASAPVRVLLLETPWFLLERVSSPWGGRLGGEGAFTILTVTRGSVRLGGKGGPCPKAGDTLLLPAGLGPVQVEGEDSSPWSLLAARPGRALGW